MLYFFYQSFFVERRKFAENDLTDVLCLELCLKNIRPIFYSISLLMLINTICVIVVISGLSGVSHIQDLFYNFFSPNLEYSKIIPNLTANQILGIDTAVNHLKILYISFIILQMLFIFVITYIIQKMRPPYSSSLHIIKILRYLIIGFKQRKIDQKQILSSLYYLILKHIENILALIYLIFIIFGGCLIGSSL